MIGSANAELVRSVYAAWARGDFSSTDWAHPDIEFVIDGGPSPGSWAGLAAMAEAHRDFVSAWDSYRMQAEDYHDLDDGSVLVLTRVSGRGKQSGLELGEIAATQAHLFHVRDAKVIRLVAHWDRERALADAGLAP